MNAVQSVSDRFNVKILEDDAKEMAQLLPQFVKDEKTLEGYIGAVSLTDPSLSQENNKKLFSLFFTSLLELVKITNVVKDRIVDIHYKMGLSDKYKIIVAYDANLLPQAMGLVLLDREDVKGRKSIELYSLITSLWNLNCPQNADHPNRVKGAGASILDFCKKLGAEQQAKYLYLVGAPGALSFYEKHGFRRVYPELANSKAEENPCKRIPMFFDLEDGQTNLELQNEQKKSSNE